MSESGYTINVTVNGLEDVERLRKAIEGVNVANALKDASAQASEAWAKALTDAMSGAAPEPERCTFTLGGKLYSVLACHAAVIQEAIEAACADLNDEPAGPRFTIGDVVSLKSGGPRMTVEGVSKDDDGKVNIDCSWFDRLPHDPAFPSWDDRGARHALLADGADFPADCLEY